MVLMLPSCKVLLGLVVQWKSALPTVPAQTPLLCNILLPTLLLLVIIIIIITVKSM